MATFRPNKNACELDFDGKYKYYLPLHEDTADQIDQAMKRIETLMPKDKTEIDDAYNTALDCIDEILGDGESDKVMSIFEKPGTLEVFDVMYYIINEWTTQYSKRLEEMKKTVPANREQRRARK